MSHPSFSRTEHRPWPLPDQPWAGQQTWCDLLFAHWPIPAEKLRPLVPNELEIQEYDGTSWVGVVPLRMDNVSVRLVPPFPWLSSFPELNLRLYVNYRDKPGIWFLSLDTTNPLAVWAARTFFYLPYYNANISLEKKDRRIQYRSERKEPEKSARFKASYQPSSDVYESEPDTLEHWLTERYCLYSESPEGKLYRVDVHHHPWPLQKADAEITENTMTHPLNIRLPDTSPLLHFASRLDVAVWLPRLISE